MSDSRTWIEVDQQGVGWEVTFSPSNSSTVYDNDVTTRRQLPPVIRNFSCRSCDNDSYEPIYHNPKSLGVGDFGPHTIIGPGPSAGMPRTDTLSITGYRCPSCTIHFEDPAKYSKNQPVEIVPPVATPENEVLNIRYGRPRDFTFSAPPLDIKSITAEAKKAK